MVTLVRDVRRFVRAFSSDSTGLVLRRTRRDRRHVAVLMLTGISLAVGIFCAPTPVAAHPAPEHKRVETPARIDPQTGRDQTNYPPDRWFDIESMSIEVVIPKVEEPRIEGRVVVGAKALGKIRREMRLNARSTIKVRSVQIEGKPCTYVHDGNMLSIDMTGWGAAQVGGEGIEPGTSVHVLVEYEAVKPFGEGTGLIFVPADEERNQAAMVYSQGQADWNSLWLPLHDYPNDRCVTELRADVPAGYVALSNGEPVEVKAGEVKPGRAVFHWRLEKPQPGYLITLVVGKFDEVVIEPSDRTTGEGARLKGMKSLPVCRVYGPVGSGASLRETFANTPEMVAFLEKLFGKAYPWGRRYGQVIVRDFQWGGMENTTLTTLSEEVLGQPRGGKDDLIVHELAHQWTGDLITCRSWNHVWLNEGWATYVEALWARHTKGDAAYAEVVDGWWASLKSKARGRAPEEAGMVSGRYHGADDTFEKAEDPYERGGFVLHMLKERLGEKAFLAGTRLYVQRHAFREVETDDFRRCLEEVSGESLERFFVQWCERPGMPRVEVSWVWDERKGEMEVRAEQVQLINEENPAYELRVPVVMELADGSKVEVEVKGETRRMSSGAVKMKLKPRGVEVDPKRTMLMDVEVLGEVER
ncbi:MAG: M1 family metallopeptidase [Phycisphaerales bacterium]|nr:M1 family metallopeptidase [Phycisphaerales bacterium]